MKRVVAVTGSKISAAHTAMAAEALEATADMLGYDIRVERRGPGGTTDPLSEVEIRNADVVILATDQPDDQGDSAAKPSTALLQEKRSGIRRDCCATPSATRL